MDYTFASNWKFFIGFIALSTVGIRPATCQISLLNSPPVMYVERNWRIPETEPVGSIIARVRAEDAENDLLQFGLEPLYHGNYANPSATKNLKRNLPFRIDQNTGVVYLNESLTGRGGENSFLYITVTDGTLTAKNEVYVNIVSKGDASKLYSSRPPSFTPPTQNLSSFLPPFHFLPGVQSDWKRPPQTNSNNIYPPYNRATNPPLLPLPPQPSPQEVINSNTNIHSNEVSSNSSSNTNPNRTKLTPIKPKTDEGDDDKLSETKKNNDNNGNQVEKSQDDNKTNTNNTTNTNTTNATIMKPIIPVVVTICAIFIAAGLIALFIYRKRLCAIGKTLKKKSKAEMAKKSNQSNISSNLTDDSRNSMVLQHWNGPTAFGNRYVPWERDNQQLSLATSQLSTSDSRMSGVSIGIGNGIGIVNGVNGVSAEMKPDQWEYPRHRLKFLNILGEGAFGQVWRCDATNPDGIKGVTTVAVKTLKENATEIEKNDLNTELKVMKSLTPHKNVVRLLGCCTDKDPIFVIIEYVNRGKLQDYLRNSRAERHYGNTHGKSNILTSGDLISFMYQVAKGMDYLTSRGLIHRDLAARNILITDDHTCKVADFGFARDVIASKVYERKSQGKQPIRWMAIESLYDNIFSAKSDIWSFGILMWEIVTLGSTPYPGKSAEDIMRKVRDGYRLEKPEHCRRELYNIMYYCWEKDPDDRPTFSELVRMFDKLLHTEMDYIELESFPDHNYYNILNLSGEKV